jgi:hypothetical protein
VVVASKKIEAESMKRADPDGWSGVGYGRGDALQELAGSPIGEGQHEDGPRVDPVMD